MLYRTKELSLAQHYGIVSTEPSPFLAFFTIDINRWHNFETKTQQKGLRNVNVFITTISHH